MAKNNVNTNATVDKTPQGLESKKETKIVAIPIDPLNKKDSIVKVTINGKEQKIKRGAQQTVSKEVYEMLVIAGYVVEG